MSTTIAPGEWLADGPATDYLAAVDAGCPGGCVTDAGRTAAEQAALFLARYEPRGDGSGPYGDVRWYLGVRYVRVSSKGSVAIPGSTQARHQTGQSLDLAEPARAWMTVHGHAFGWVAGLVQGEPWHFEHPSITPVTAFHTTPQEDTPMDADLAARLDQIVTWIDQRLTAADAAADTRRDQLAGFTRDVVSSLPGVDQTAIEAAMTRAMANGLDIAVTVTTKGPAA